MGGGREEAGLTVVDFDERAGVLAVHDEPVERVESARVTGKEERRLQKAHIVRLTDEDQVDKLMVSFLPADKERTAAVKDSHPSIAPGISEISNQYSLSCGGA